MKLRKVNDEVFVADPPIVQLGRSDITFLKQQALSNPRKRARICAHPSNDDALHEMMIAIASASYIHPHRHLRKSESFHIVEGEVDVVIFDNDGAVLDVIELGDVGSGRKFYYRLSESMFHTLIIRTDFILMHEVTNGPFDPERTILAPFAPPEQDVEATRAYMKHLSAVTTRHLGR